MRALIRLAALIVISAAIGGAAGRETWAQGDADFFRNKPMRFMITFEPGGSYDLYARLAATHLSKHIPGQPAINVTYHPGAGGLVGILHFAEKAAQDGSEIAILPRDVAINQRLRPETAKYDARRFNWIGTLATYPGIMFIASRTGVKTAEDLRRIETVAGSWGPTSETFITPTLLNALADTKFKDRQRLSRRARRRSGGRARRGRRPHGVVDPDQDPARAMAAREVRGDPVPGRDTRIPTSRRCR